MKEEIVDSLDNPRQLERLYRNNETSFKKAFNSIYGEIKSYQTAEVWNERLNYQEDQIDRSPKRELIFVVVASLVAGIIAKFPIPTGLDPDFFYPRNISFAVLPLLILYFAQRRGLTKKRTIIVSVLVLFSIVYINSLPEGDTGDTLMLACIHLPLFLWAVLGFTFLGDKLKSYQERIDFLKYNGDLVVMTAVILLAGMLLTLITFALFSATNISIETFYLQYVVVWGLVASPIVGTYLIQNSPQLISKVSPVIARVFTPLVLVTLVIYLFVLVGSGGDPYRDREVLIIFNLLLVGVMALILFSVTETSKGSQNQLMIWLLFLLSVVTIIINGIALSAILFRILEWGITPNRLAVFGSNVLILAHLFIVAYRLYQTVSKKSQVERVAQSIAIFLPIYSIWTVLVTFAFPIVFSFK